MALDEDIQSLSVKIQLLQRSWIRLEKENRLLQKQLNESKEELQQKQSQIEMLVQKINVLQLNTGNLNDEEKKQLQKKIDKYLLDIDKCIELLNL